MELAWYFRLAIALIVGLIAFLYTLFGDFLNEKSKDIAVEVEASVQVRCEDEDEKLSVPCDEGRVPPVRPNGLLPSPSGYPDP